MTSPGPASRPNRILADYIIESPVNPARAEEAMSGEQSSGTIVAVAGESPELKARVAARVESAEIVGDTSIQSLPGSASAKNGK